MIVFYVAMSNAAIYNECLLGIWSLRTTGEYRGRICLITDGHYKTSPDVASLTGDRELGIEIIHIAPKQTAARASGYKLRALESLGPLAEGESIVYLDTDVVVCRPVDFDAMLASVESGKVGFYGYQNGYRLRTQKNRWMAGYLTRDEDVLRHVGFCAGVMVFRNDPRLRYFFETTRRDYERLLDEKRVNGSWEQPILCLNAIRGEVANVTLTPYVVDGFMRDVGEDDKATFFHFCGHRRRRAHLMKALATRQSSVRATHSLLRQSERSFDRARS